MRTEDFTLRPTDEYIELIVLLKVLGLSQTGGHAKIMVAEGEVKVNGEVEYRKRNKLRPGDKVEIEGVEVNIKGA